MFNEIFQNDIKTPLKISKHKVGSLLFCFQFFIPLMNLYIF